MINDNDFKVLKKDIKSHYVLINNGNKLPRAGRDLMVLLIVYRMQKTIDSLTEVWKKRGFEDIDIFES